MFGEESNESLSKSGKRGGQRVSPERRNWVRRESAMILSKNLMVREKTKEKMALVAHQRAVQATKERAKRMVKWAKKTLSSPFAVDLAAEDERVAEEHRIREEEEFLRTKRLANRKEKAKNEIVLRALSEFSDLDALRREKRAIQEEEQRLRALLELEKASVSQKADRLAAERASRQRRDAKLYERRENYQKSMEVIQAEEEVALKKKFNMQIGGKPQFAVRPLHAYPGGLPGDY